MRIAPFLAVASVVFVSFTSGARAGDPGKAVAPVTFQEKPSRWSLGVGVTVRTIDADFHVRRPDPIPWQRLLRTRSNSGRGDVGLYTGGPGTVVYSDGQVGPEYGAIYGGANPNGDAVGIINSASQLTPTGRIDTLGSPTYDLAFHSSETTYAYSHRHQLNGFDSSDSDDGVGPYITLSYDIIQSPACTAGIMIGWSMVETEHGTGTRSLGWQSVSEHRTDSSYTYHYDYDGVGGAALPGATFPFNANDPAEGFIIYDPVAYDANGNGAGYLFPRKTASSRHASRLVALVEPVATSKLDVNLNEIVLAARLERALNDRLRVAVAVGPTLNVLDTEFSTTIAWRVPGTGRTIATTRYEDDSTEVEVGIMGQLSITCDITERLFIEAHGSYRWVDSVRVGGAAASVEVDASSWEGGVGIGVRL
jgi:hypothetical protein